MQEASQEIYATKYQLKDGNGVVVDKDYNDTIERVSTALADVELTPELQSEWHRKFKWALENGALPAGRIISNAGAEKYKPNTSLINCVVSNTIPDSIDGIGKNVHQAMLSLAAGCGIGYCFSSLRPRNAFVNGVGAVTSGSLSFMNIFDTQCFTIASAGGRRGAQMATMHCWHPDIIEYIKAKREVGRFRQFNLSVLITDAFMQAVKDDNDWSLYFPVHGKELASKCTLRNVDDIPFKSDDYIYTDDSKSVTICKVYHTMKARELFDLIMKSNYDFAEPGVLFIDKINRENPLNSIEVINATNPCGV